MRCAGLLVACLVLAACDKKHDAALGLGIHDQPVERGRVVVSAASVPPGGRVTVCTRLLLMPRARCDGWAEARGGAITGTQLHELVRMQSRMKRVKRMLALRLGAGADPNIDGAPIDVPEDANANFVGFAVTDDRGNTLLFLDATVN